MRHQIRDEAFKVWLYPGENLKQIQLRMDEVIFKKLRFPND